MPILYRCPGVIFSKRHHPRLYKTVLLSLMLVMRTNIFEFKGRGWELANMMIPGESLNVRRGPYW